MMNKDTEESGNLTTKSIVEQRKRPAECMLQFSVEGDTENVHNRKYSRTSSFSTAIVNSPKASEGSYKIVRESQVVTPQTCASSQATPMSESTVKPLNLSESVEGIPQTAKSCMRNLSKCMDEAQSDSVSKSKQNTLNENITPTDTIEDEYEEPFEYKPVFDYKNINVFEEILPLNSLANQSMRWFHDNPFNDDFNPLGEAQMPLSSQY